MLKSFRFGTENNQEDIKSEDKAHKFLILETLHNSLLSEKKTFPSIITPSDHQNITCHSLSVKQMNFSLCLSTSDHTEHALHSILRSSKNIKLI